MITIILCKGKGLDSEELSLFEQEKIAGISLFERSLISLSNERLLDELKKLVLSKGFLKLYKDKFCLEISFHIRELFHF